jgi:anaerobic dimethyl sulfoxide reductase subunit B (iron-sulfur subunit)
MSGHLAFYFDQTRCIGCLACIVACKQWHDVPAGPARWRRVLTVEKGSYPDLFVAFLSTGCLHCAEPSCAGACPFDAITKRDNDGVVVVDQEECVGADSCGRPCLEACPYDAPQFGAEENPKIQKCGFCLDRWPDGKLPICVAACPTRAMDAGPIEEIRARYGTNTEAVGFTYSEKLGPSIVLKLKKEVCPDVTILE